MTTLSWQEAAPNEWHGRVRAHHHRAAYFVFRFKGTWGASEAGGGASPHGYATAEEAKRACERRHNGGGW